MNNLSRVAVWKVNFRLCCLLATQFIIFIGCQLKDPQLTGDAPPPPARAKPSVGFQSNEPKAPPIDGSCSPDTNGSITKSTPTGKLCDSGSATPVLNTNGLWKWDCQGSNGGSTGPCQASPPPPPPPAPVGGRCGQASGMVKTTAPTDGFCAVGTPSFLTGTGPWKWSCTGSNGGSTDNSCQTRQPAPVNGLCGTANGTTSTSAPTANDDLCKIGTASAVSGNGPWNWTCQGSHNGSIMRCTTQLKERKFPEMHCVAAVTFEDQFPRRTDHDYNDFLTDFKIVQKINPQGQITDVYVDFFPRAVGASFDHSFLMVLKGTKDGRTNTFQSKPMFKGDAEVSLTYYDADGNLLSGKTRNHLDPNHDIIIFESTHDLFIDTRRSGQVTNLPVINTKPGIKYIRAKENARLHVQIADPSQNPVGEEQHIDIAKFRMMLHVPTTGQDIDIIDVNPVNWWPGGFPSGFVIPDDWRWPREGADLSLGYPKFAQYRQYLIEKQKDPNTPLSDDTAAWFEPGNIGDESTLYNESLPPPPNSARCPEVRLHDKL